jgi:hypothetical protein
MKKILVAIAAVTLLSACGTAATPGSSAPTAGSNRPAASAETTAPAPEVTTDAPTVDPNEPVSFGSTKTYEDGLSVTVSKGTNFTPSQYASADKAKAYLKYTITVVNGTGKVFDPSMFNASVQSSNTEGGQVFDSEKGLEGAPSTKLLKGREAKFTIGFGVADPKDVVMEVTPSFEHESVLFN